MNSSLGFVPFITGKAVCDLVSDHYHDAPLARIGLCDIARLKADLPNVPLWIDSGTDGLDGLADALPAAMNSTDPRFQWYSTIKSFDGFKKIADPNFHKSPTSDVVNQFVDAALNACVRYHPRSVSVPQLPYVSDTSRNKINKALAVAAGNWQLKHPKVSLVLPVILKEPNLTASKMSRNPCVKQAYKCLAESKAQACWIVDASLNDEEQSASTRRKKIEGVIAFHQEFNKAVEGMPLKRIGGPYWCVNLLLWSRGLVDQFGTGIGTGYRYYLPCGYRPPPGNARIPIPPLFRRATTSPELRLWIDESLATLSSTHPLHSLLLALRSRTGATKAEARAYTAKVYRDWINQIASAPAVGRNMALFQALSVAFSYGKQLPRLPATENATRAPESIVEPLMLNCL